MGLSPLGLSPLHPDITVLVDGVKHQITYVLGLSPLGLSPLGLGVSSALGVSPLLSVQSVSSSRVSLSLPSFFSHPALGIIPPPTPCPAASFPPPPPPLPQSSCIISDLCGVYVSVGILLTTSCFPAFRPLAPQQVQPAVLKVSPASHTQVECFVWHAATASIGTATSPTPYRSVL